MRGVAHAYREGRTRWGHLWRLAATLGHLVLQPDRALLTTVRHRGVGAITVALQTEGLCMVRGLPPSEDPRTVPLHPSRLR